MTAETAYNGKHSYNSSTLLEKWMEVPYKSAGRKVGGE
jgi:hypothetical protein